ncbi:MAG: endonuclease MutS2 [Cyanobacteriota bacterium]
MNFELNSTEQLDWNSVLLEISRKANSELGKEYCLNLPFAKNTEEAEKLQKQVTEALNLINEEGKIDIGGFRNIKKHLSELEKGITIQGTSFLEISSTLRSVRNLKKFIEAKLKEGDEIYDIVFPLYTNHNLEIEIERSFSSDGTVLDSASVELGRIRSSIRETQQNIKERLLRLIQEPRYKGAIQDQIITIRNGRYVISVKAESQSTIKGIIQDQSQSGLTVYLEPMAIIDENNKLSKKLSEELTEIQKILFNLGLKIIPNLELFYEIVSKMSEIDSIIAKAEYCISINAKKPFINNKGFTDLHKVKHPLLVSQKGYDNVIPIDIILGKIFDTMIITGSNTGGKTVALKTLGLCALMAKIGLYLPTKTESDIAFFENVLADIGDEQSIEQNLSTFSSHLTNIKKILDNTNEKTLVLLDEIGTGTDPTEGAAIAQSVIENLRKKGAKILVTTHYGELKTLAYKYTGISNASVEFDSESLSPTYKLMIGVPGKSNAIHIAKKLGLDDEITERSREIINSNKSQDVNLSIEKLELEYKNLAEERKNFEDLTISLKIKEDKFSKDIEDLEHRRKRIKEQVYEDFDKEIKKSLEEIKDVVRELQTGKTSQNAEKARKKVEELSNKVTGDYKKELEMNRPKVPKIIVNVGDYFYLEKLRQIVQVIKKTKDEEKFEVQAGILKLTVNIDELKKPEGKEQKLQIKGLKNKGNLTTLSLDNSPQNNKKSSNETQFRNAFNECDLRGLFVEEALEKAEKFLDASSLTGFSPVYIIHGKGSGILRDAVRSMLRDIPSISNFRAGEYFEGGEGISVIYFKS